MKHSYFVAASICSLIQWLPNYYVTVTRIGDTPTANDILSPILDQKCFDQDAEGFQIISQLLMAHGRRKYGHKVGEKDYLPPALFFTM